MCDCGWKQENRILLINNYYDLTNILSSGADFYVISVFAQGRTGHKVVYAVSATDLQFSSMDIFLFVKL